MSYIIEKKDRRHRFKNVHGNYSKKYKAKVKLFNDPDKKNFEAYNSVSKEIPNLIKLSILEQTPIRICGSRWSLSEAPYVNGILVHSVNAKNKPDLKFKGFLNDQYLQSSSEPNEFLFVQSGNTIKDLNTYCTKAERSLPTSGASNGQTIAGAMNTGVNGSAIEVGCVQDFVVGLHIIRGDGDGDSVYLEPASSPIINQKFADKINATIIRDDDLFYSALVGLGAFGYVHGVVIQTVPLFDLHNYIKKVDISVAYKYTNHGKFVGTALSIPEMDPNDLYHLKFYINQYDIKDNVRAEIIYKVPTGGRIFGPLLRYAKDFLLKIGLAVVTIADDLIPPLINTQLPKDGEYEAGYLGEIFGDTTNIRIGQFSCAIAVKCTDAERITKLMINHFKKKGVQKIPSAFSYRFVKKSKAILAYTKFDKNCIIGIDGLSNKPTKKYLKEISQLLIKTGVPHTWHWGKRNEMDANFVQTMYGDQLQLWKHKRNEFLSPAVASAFSSEYLDKLGLTKDFA